MEGSDNLDRYLILDLTWKGKVTDEGWGYGCGPQVFEPPLDLPCSTTSRMALELRTLG